MLFRRRKNIIFALRIHSELCRPGMMNAANISPPRGFNSLP
ncbi:Uncharacterized protein dnm_065510 [Desulfonema magnum]|uniref:Uncharacterized protein n=1 Tax=Desulfonema magnum TaxID=45655 RepID=A0A975BSY0_9BACT|nr:Uncharacterized protein dnm_065510 [Desulfonema magnum]